MMNMDVSKVHDNMDVRNISWYIHVCYAMFVIHHDDTEVPCVTHLSVFLYFYINVDVPNVTWHLNVRNVRYAMHHNDTQVTRHAAGSGVGRGLPKALFKTKSLAPKSELLLLKVANTQCCAFVHVVSFMYVRISISCRQKVHTDYTW